MSYTTRFNDVHALRRGEAAILLAYFAAAYLVAAVVAVILSVAATTIASIFIGLDQFEQWFLSYGLIFAAGAFTCLAVMITLIVVLLATYKEPFEASDMRSYTPR